MSAPPRVRLVELPAAQGRRRASETAFKGLFARLAQGVTIVTSYGPEGPCGMTASSVTSVSLDPPLALVCLTNDSRTLAVLTASGRFALSLLKVEHDERSSAFSSPGSDQERFERFPFSLRDGMPLLRDALAWAICRVEALVRAGDHTIAIGLVEGAGHDDGEPLVWHLGGYRELAA
jgi:flavin reductase (DIM6/NTAB) family NADH-FMN oxidoreductase RutF